MRFALAILTSALLLASCEEAPKTERTQSAATNTDAGTASASGSNAGSTSGSGSTTAPARSAVAGQLAISGELIFGADAENNFAGTEPAADAKVFLESDPSKLITTDAQGAFTLAIANDAAALRLAEDPSNIVLIGQKEVNGKTFVVRQRGINALSGISSIDLGKLKIKEPGAFQGRVFLGDKVEHIGIDVYVPGTSYIAKTDRDGLYLMTGVPEGDYELVAEKAGYKLLSLGSYHVDSKKVKTVAEQVLDTDDLTAPDTSLIAGPPPHEARGLATFHFSANERGAVFSCRLDAGAFQPCVSPQAFAGLGDGTHKFEVFATDRGGNADASPVVVEWDVDSTAPGLRLISGPSLGASTADVTIVTEPEAGSAISCRIDGGEFAPCAASIPYTGLASGFHRFEGYSVDAAGNRSLPLILNWEVDSVAPLSASVAVDAGDYTKTAAVSLHLFAIDARQMCVWGDIAGAAAPCPDAGATGWVTQDATAAVTLSGSDGLKTVNAKYRDLAGNVSTTATTTVTLDRTAPDVTAATFVQTGTAAAGSSTAVSRVNSVSIAVAGITDAAPLVSMLVSDNSAFAGATWQAYSTSFGWTYNGADGARTLYYRVRDAAGNESANMISNALTIDRTAPGAPVISGGTSLAGGLTGTNVTIETTIEVGAALSCRLDGAAFAACTASKTYNGLASGPHQFEAYAVDPAGNQSLLLSASWEVDVIAPGSPTIVIGAGAYTNTASVVLNLSAASAYDMCIWGNVTGAATECSNVGSTGWVTYDITKTVTLAGANGPKTVNVKFRDAAGNVSATASDSVELDSVAPDVTGATLVQTGTAATGDSTTNTRLNSLGVALAGVTDASALTEMMVSDDSSFAGAAWQAYATAFLYTYGGADGNRRLYLKVKDGAGNVSATVASNVIALDRAPPQSALLILNGGAQYTSSQNLALSHTATGATQYQVSTDGTFSAGGWLTYAASTGSFDIGATNGLRTVSVAFRDAAGNETTSTASITLDTGVPVVALLTLLDIAAGGHHYTNTNALTAVIQTASTDVYEMQISTDGTFDSEVWTSFAVSSTVLLPGVDCVTVDCKSVMARVRDRAGNVSNTVSASTTLDRVAPTAPQFATTASTVTSASTSLAIAAAVVDPFFYRYEVRLGNGSPSYFTTQSDTSFPVTLTSAGFNPQSTFRIRAVDLAGNVSNEDFVTITLDSGAPAAPSDVQILPGDGKLKVEWKESTSPDVVQYLIFYSYQTSPSGADDPLAPDTDQPGRFANEGNSPIVVQPTKRGTQTFTMTGIPDRDVFVRVEAVDAIGLHSAVPATPGTSAVARPSAVPLQRLTTYASATAAGDAEITQTAIHGDIMVVSYRCQYQGIAYITTGSNTKETPDEVCDTTAAKYGSIHVLSIADPTSPRLLARCSADSLEDCGLSAGETINDAREVVYDGLYAYVANGKRGVAIISLANPAAPTKVATCPHDGTCLPVAGFAHNIRTQGGLLFVADGGGGMRILENRKHDQIYKNKIVRCSGGALKDTSCVLNTVAAGAPEYAPGGELTAYDPVAAGLYDKATGPVGYGGSGGAFKRCGVRHVELETTISGTTPSTRVIFSVTGPWNLDNTAALDHIDLCPSGKVFVLPLFDDSTDTATNNDTLTVRAPTQRTLTKPAIEVPLPSTFGPRYTIADLDMTGDVLLVSAYKATHFFMRLLAYSTNDVISSGGSSSSLIFDNEMKAGRIWTNGPHLFTAPNSSGHAAIEIYSLSTLNSLATAHATGASYSEEALPYLGGWGDGRPGYRVSSIMTSQSLLFFSITGFTGATHAAEDARDLITMDTQVPDLIERLPLADTIVGAREDRQWEVMRHNDRNILIGSGNTIDAYDITSPQSPKESWSGALATKMGGTPNVLASTDMEVDGPFLYTAFCQDNTANSLVVYVMPAADHLATPTTKPQAIATVPFPNDGGSFSCDTAQKRITGLELVGRFLLVANGTDGVYVMNVADPGYPYFVSVDGAGAKRAVAPTLGGTEAWVRDVVARGRYFYMAEGNKPGGSGTTTKVSSFILPTDPTTSTSASLTAGEAYSEAIAGSNQRYGISRLAIRGSRLYATCWGCTSGSTTFALGNAAAPADIDATVAGRLVQLSGQVAIASGQGAGLSGKIAEFPFLSPALAFSGRQMFLGENDDLDGLVVDVSKGVSGSGASLITIGYPTNNMQTEGVAVGPYMYFLSRDEVMLLELTL